jgi:hypothetical protein
VRGAGKDNPEECRQNLVSHGFLSMCPAPEGTTKHAKLTARLQSCSLAGWGVILSMVSTAIQQCGIVVLWLIHARGDRPHGHRNAVSLINVLSQYVLWLPEPYSASRRLASLSRRQG